MKIAWIPFCIAMVFAGLSLNCSDDTVGTDCVDADGDGYGVGPDCDGADCDDADSDCHAGDCCAAPECVDADSDGYGDGPGCDGPDCDDQDPQCWEGGCCSPPLLDCAQVLDCALACDLEQLCMDECLERAEPGARSIAEALFACMQANGCQEEDCLIQRCQPHLLACMDDICIDEDGDGFGAGDACAGRDCDDRNPLCWAGDCCSPPLLDCSQVLDCALACDLDTACMQTCLEQADPEARSLAEELYACIEAYNCQDEDCIFESCWAEIQACLNDQCTDLDGDGYGTGDNCLGQDCDDADPRCWEGDCCEAGQQSCAQILDCVLTCEMDLGCMGNCMEQGDPVAQQLAQDVFECAVANSCFDEACLFEYCWVELQACMDDQCVDRDGDGYGSGPACAGPDCDDADPGCWEGACCTVEPLNCAQLLDCAMDCDMDQVCLLDCISQGDPQAQRLAQDLYLCIDAHSCQDEACIFEYCWEELQACLNDQCQDEDGDGRGTGAGCLGPDCDDADPSCWEGSCCTGQDLGCAEILDCAMGCDMEIMCIQGCMEQGDPEARQLAQGVWDCALANNCLDEMCLFEYCGAELQACLNDRCTDQDGDGYGTGDGCDGPDCDDTDPACWEGACCDAQLLDCAGILDCAMGCDLDPSCIFFCMQQGDPVARQLAQGVWDCALANNCLDEVCLFEYCGAEIQACMNDRCADQDGDGYGTGGGCLGPDCDDTDPACHSGACCDQGLDCSGVLNCAMNCDWDLACIDGCIAQGDPEAQLLAGAVLDCAVANNCLDEACMLEHCWDPLQACLYP